MGRSLDHSAAPSKERDAGKPETGASDAPYRLYNIGNNNPVQLMDFIAAIETALGKKAQKNFLPLQPGDVPATYADIDALVGDIGYRPETKLEDGIAKFISWYREYYGK